jgi:hypothetical protein
MMEQQKLSFCLNYCRLNRNLVCMHAFEYYHVQVTSHFQDPVLRKLMGVYMSLSLPLICAHTCTYCVKNISLSLCQVRTHTSYISVLDVEFILDRQWYRYCNFKYNRWAAKYKFDQSNKTISYLIISRKKYCYVYP